MLFDTHLHLIYPDRLSYPWLEDVPALNAPADMDDYATRARRLGITGCLHMEVDVAPEQIRAETLLVRDLMAGPDTLLRGAISSCRPEDEDFPEFLDWALAQPEIRGFRRVLHVVPDAVSQSARFRDNLRRLTGTGRTFDIVARPDQLSLVAELVDHCPEVPFILDHCGVPDIAGGGFAGWEGPLSEIAKRPNVTAKISGIVAYADPAGWRLDDLAPYVDHVARAFGPDRLVWGSDRPVCNLGGGLETWVAATHALTRGWTAADRAALFRDNAQRLWKIET